MTDAAVIVDIHTMEAAAVESPPAMVRVVEDATGTPELVQRTAVSFPAEAEIAVDAVALVIVAKFGSVGLGRTVIEGTEV